MVFFRGSVRDFEIWKNEYGLEGWGYNDVLPYFKKFENNEDVRGSAVHGYSGPINISKFPILLLFLYFILFLYIFLVFC